MDVSAGSLVFSAGPSRGGHSKTDMGRSGIRRFCEAASLWLPMSATSSDRDMQQFSGCESMIVLASPRRRQVGCLILTSDRFDSEVGMLPTSYRAARPRPEFCRLPEFRRKRSGGGDPSS